MKRILSLILVAALTLGVLALVGCGKKDETLKLGLGVQASATASNANADANGAGTLSVTVAAVLVDANGKIVQCFLDCAESTVEHTVKGKFVAADGFQTKYEKGEGYDMVEQGGANREWYKQADAFKGLVLGKTVSEVKALMAADYKGTEEVQNAGCTIYVSDFVLAIEKAVNSAVATDATANDTLKVGITSSQSSQSDATEDVHGLNQIDTTVFAAVAGADGKIVANKIESVQVDFVFDVNGVSKFDKTKPVLGKYEQGDAYNMVGLGGANREWYKQADAFSALANGKTAGDVSSLMGTDYKGTEEVQNAGCTIYVSTFVKAASKAK